MSQQPVRLSVDFGTSNTVAALGYPDGRVRTLLFDGSPTLPSAVFLDPSGGLLVGRDAEHTARTAPDRYEPNPKRRIDERTVLLGGTELAVTDLIAAVLLRVATEARRVAGGGLSSVTLTHPAAWAHTRRQILVEAAERAGIPPTTLVPEPSAAADTFLAVSGGTVPAGSGVVVYDLGAGTFDASVVRRGPNGFEVVAAEGLSQGGGLDIDAAIVGHLGAMGAGHDGAAWTRLLNPTTSEERRANRLLWEDVRQAKELLSRADHTHIHVPMVGVDVPLSRAQFEHLARPILDATINATRAALNGARVAPGDVAGIFLVGGGSRIPLVATLLQQALGRPPTITEQPELVVAEGGLRAAGGPVESVAVPPPVSSPPAFAPPVSPPPAASVHFPVSTPPVQPMSAPAQPSYQPMASLPVQPPVPSQAGPQVPATPQRPERPRRTRLIAIVAAVVLVVAIGAVALVTYLRNGQTVDMNRSVLADGQHSITLTGIKVTSNRLRVNLRYVNRDSEPWGLVCPSAAEDLQSSYLKVEGRAVFPVETWCTKNAAGGKPVPLAANDSGDSYAIFPVVPAKGTPFSLYWYGSKVDGLTL